ncbi:MAG: type 4a pilus biogenesis protein PilO [Thermoguttaceae bacterium]|nr:type 4a pilus biogenesis protein PilO [Thermoguttaceae bacterium]MDW8038338.1 type 4a pilus biogenesis protein PilO [Thermoguttaceae bacterium]
MILVGLGAYGYFILRPQYLYVKKLREELHQLHQGVDQAGDLWVGIQNVQKELEKATRYVQAWQADAPNPGELAPLFGQITQLAKQSGLTPTRFSPGNKISYDRLVKIPLTIVCQGDFAQIHEFLYSLEKLPQIIWIDRFAIEKASKSNQQLQCEISLVIFTENPEISDQIKDSKKPI